MKPRRRLASVCLELAAVLLLSGAAFWWAKEMALDARGYEAVGGEYLLLLLPVIYYTGKRMILDWIADIRKLRKRCNHG